MGREWQPGDVAVATMTTRNGPRLIRRRVSDSYPWEVIGGDESGGIVAERAIAEARPVSLVVIDPEDREQIERLTQVYADMQHGFAELTAEPWTMPAMRMRQALREFANPTLPKPDEPTGLGAVVEDAKGTLWFRMASENQTWPGEVWQEQYGDADRWSKWESVTAVRILSDGVTP